MTLSLLDTTVLSNFAHTRRPELVQLALGNQVATTPTVLAELHQGEALGLVPLVDWHWLPLLTLTAAEQALAKQQQNVLDAGEAWPLCGKHGFSATIWLPEGWLR